MKEATSQRQTSADAAGDTSQLPNVSIPTIYRRIDLATLIGILGTFGLIVAAISMGSDAEFLNLPSILMVVIGTLFATATSYTGAELRKSGQVIGETILGTNINPSAMAAGLLDLAVVAKKKGILVLSNYDSELKKDGFLHKAVQMVIDGYTAADVEFFLSQELEADIERHKRSAGITRRASEIAPAMGLIGTLVGLVQMLANLDSPETIGPAMAVALLTTFYGAILGTIVMAPLAVKLEKRSSDNALIKIMITLTCISIAKQDNPRKLEMMLNAELPPSKRIRYFD